MKKFAIIGEGEVAGLHAKNIAEKARLAAVCGLDEAKAFSEKYGAKSYDSVDDLLLQKDVEIVVVCSPTGHHAEQIIKSLQAGKDVVVDGPLCLTKAAAWQIIETEKYCRRRLFLIQPSRFYPSFIQLQKQLDEQGFKKILSFDVKCILQLPAVFFSGPDGKRFPGGGLLYNPFGSLMTWLVSFFGEVDSVAAFLPEDLQKEQKIEGFGAAVLKMTSGVIGTLNWSSAEKITDKPTTITIVTDSGIAEAGFDCNELLFTKANNSVVTKREEAFGNEFYAAVYDDLLKAFEGMPVQFPGSLDGAKTVEAIEKIYKACR